MASKTIYVYADWEELRGAQLLGTLRAERVKGQEIYSFEYEKSWLKSNHSAPLDPDLFWYSGPQYLLEKKKNFGFFLDSSPDRWGQTLMRRREAILARMENRPQKSLLPSDYLLGVFDEHRMGALRFKDDLEGPFLNDNRKWATPPWTSLRELEYASLKIEEDIDSKDPEYLQWLNLLIAPGSSLGGARPKASVSDQHNHLWIAKFPSVNDMIDVGGWEMVVHDLAKMAGLNVPEAKVQRFGSNRFTFLTRRFDRTSGGRIHFASAMTLTGKVDGDDFQSGASYLDLAGIIIQSGDKHTVDLDLKELWKRIVFNICIRNTDDHLRNHGFLLGNTGWRLSPAYDMNPVPTGTGLTLNINEEDNTLNLDLALEIATYFRIESTSAQVIIEDILQATKKWRVTSEKYGLSKIEQEIVSAAFEH